jgi:hypothetical protein
MAKLKFCTNCGAPASSGRFCTSCGSALETPDDVSVQQRHATTVADATVGSQEGPAAMGAAAVAVEVPVEGPAGPGGDLGAPTDIGPGGSEPAASDAHSAAADSELQPPAVVAPRNLAPGPAASQPDSARESLPQSPAPRPGVEQVPGGSSEASSGYEAPISKRPPWVPIALSAGTVLALFAIVVVVLISVGSNSKSTSKSGSKSVTLPAALIAARADFLRVGGVPYFAMLPAGWSAIAVRPLPGIVSALTVKSPIDEGAVITVGQVQHPPATLAAEGSTLIKADASKPGFRQGSVGTTKLRDGTPTWIGSYDLGGLTTLDYVVRSCNSMLVVSANVAPAQVTLLGDKLDTVASAIHQGC